MQTETPHQTHASTVYDDALNWLIDQLLKRDTDTPAYALVKLIRHRRHAESAAGNHRHTESQAAPTGPFRVDKSHQCALLVYVPRSLKSRLIDDATGAYGYSHVTIDVAEVDEPTGQRVMTESTTDDVVRRSFQDCYGPRPFVRIPLVEFGVDCADFRACVNAALGEKYDDKEALTWGEVNDPAKQICSDLAGDCLPRSLRAAIVRKRKQGEISRLAVSVHQRGKHVFISPNGFCQFFGVPHGRHITQPDHLFIPHAARRLRPRVRQHYNAWVAVLVLTALASVIIGLWLRTQYEARRALQLS